MAKESEKSPTRAEQRANEITAAMAEIVAILDRTDTTFGVEQTMVLAPDASPRYTYRVALVAKS